MATHKDYAGQTYQSPDGKTAQAGTQVKINTPSGQIDGRMNGSGHVVPNKK